MKIIKQVEIKNFRSFGNKKGETTKLTKIDSLNIISGANDSGKSNILRALNLFFNGFTNITDFFDFDRDYHKKENRDSDDVKEEIVTIKITFHHEKNHGKNHKNPKRAFLPEHFWVSKKWKKTSTYSQSDLTSNIETSFKHEKKHHYQNFLNNREGALRSMTKASLQKQLTEFLGSIQFHYIPAIKDRAYFSHLYGELQQTLWKAEKSVVEKKKNEFQDVIQKETSLLMDEFKETLNHPSLNFDPAFQLPKNMIDLFKTLHVRTGAVDLKYRGDGVQAKLIPEILFYIATKEKSITRSTVRQGSQSKKYFIWGFEEPENSYEYRNAQLLADRFKEKFTNHAQIFLTTHSFNFISINSANTSKYRVWKDKKTSSSKISRLKETTSGQLVFEGVRNEEDDLLDELGFFHLNDEVMKAYKKVESLNIEYKDKLATITKPIVYTEGKNTEFLKIARQLFSPDFDYSIESLGGKDEIKKFFTQFSNGNFDRYKIIFIFDCDAVNEYNYCKNLETPYLIPYILPKNNSNTIPEVQSGIENMFSGEMFQDESLLFTIEEFIRDGNVQSRKRKLRKNEFLELVETNHADENSFINFEPVQDFIETQFSTS